MGLWNGSWQVCCGGGPANATWLPPAIGTAVPVCEYRAPHLDRHLTLDFSSVALSGVWWVPDVMLLHGHAGIAALPGATGTVGLAMRRDRPVSEFMLEAARRLTKLGCVGPSDGALNHDRYVYRLADD